MIDKKQKLIEIARSFSFKLNCGNYESRDFFCSQKAEALEKDAEKVSEELYKFCRNEVIKSVNSYKKSLPKPKQKKPFKVKIAEREEKVDSLKREEELKDKPL